MKFLKILLYAVAILFAIYLVLCFMGPKHMATTKSQLINASPQSIYEEIADLNKWAAWSPWHKMDPKMTSTVTGNPGEVGHKQEWKSDNSNVGDGSQTFSEVRANEYIKTELRMMGEDATPAYAEFTLKPEGEGTMVTWSMDGGDTPFLMRGMMKIINIDAIMNEQFSQGLTDLKAVVEAKPKTAAIAYEVIDLPVQWYVGVMHAQLNMKDITSEMFGKDYGAIAEIIGKAGKTPGMPISIAHNYNGETGIMDMENAMVVDAEIKVPSGFTCASIPAGRAVKHVYTGPYEGTGSAWTPLMDEVMSKYKPRWDGYEVYANDPATVSSSAEYITWLIQPIE